MAIADLEARLKDAKVTLGIVVFGKRGLRSQIEFRIQPMRNGNVLELPVGCVQQRRCVRVVAVAEVRMIEVGLRGGNVVAEHSRANPGEVRLRIAG